MWACLLFALAGKEIMALSVLHYDMKTLIHYNRNEKNSESA